MNERIKLMKQIQSLDFAALETNLYLDAYPDNQQAIDYFNKTVELLENAIYEYEKKYGPITADKAAESGKWEWTKKPWPWELEANC